MAHSSAPAKNPHQFSLAELEAKKPVEVRRIRQLLGVARPAPARNLPTAQEILFLDRRRFSEPQKAKLLLRCCYILRDQNEFSLAVATSKEAIVRFAFLCDLPSMGKALIDSAVMLRSDGLLDAAIQAYQSGLLLLPEDENYYRFSVYQGLGICHVQKHNIDKARIYMRKAFAFLEETNAEDHLYAWALWLEAEINLAEKDYQSASASFLRIKEIYESVGSVFDLATVSLRLCRVFLALGDLSKMRELAFNMDTIIRPLHKEHKYLAAALSEFQKSAFEGRADEARIDCVLALLRSRGASSAEAPRA